MTLESCRMKGTVGSPQFIPLGTTTTKLRTPLDERARSCPVPRWHGRGRPRVTCSPEVLGEQIVRSTSDMAQNQAVRTVVAAIEVLTGLVMTSIGKATGAGVTLMDRQGWRLSAAATSQIVLDADDAQYRLNEGPCLAAWETQRPVRVQDMSTEPRWPEWVKTARELGLASVLSTPLVADGRLLGAVKVYSTSAYAFDQQTLRVLNGVSETASLLLARVLPPPTEPGALAEFEAALRRSDPLQTAQNIIMERFRISAAAAIRMLATEAELSGRPERDVAAAIIDAAPPR